jgi:Mg2+ and Co2+ transporters
MLAIYTTEDNRLTRIQEFVPGAWINLVNPSESELAHVADALAIPPDFLSDPLDIDERARIEADNGSQLIVIRASVRNVDAEVPYATMPIGIILTAHNVVTVCRAESEIIRLFEDGKVRTFNPANRTRFTIQIIQRMALTYLSHLKDLNRMTGLLEQELRKAMRNEELFRLLNLEKSLVYFMTSLKANDIIMERMSRSHVLKLKEEELDLLDDALTEVKQAIGMTNIYSDILSGMMDAFASIISNNVNTVMKLLTGVTIILMIPNLLASIFGMNVELPWQHEQHAFILVMTLAGLLSVVGVLFFIKKRWF